MKYINQPTTLLTIALLFIFSACQQSDSADSKMAEETATEMYGDEIPVTSSSEDAMKK